MGPYRIHILLEPTRPCKPAVCQGCMSAALRLHCRCVCQCTLYTMGEWGHTSWRRPCSSELSPRFQVPAQTLPSRGNTDVSLHSPVNVLRRNRSDCDTATCHRIDLSSSCTSGRVVIITVEPVKFITLRVYYKSSRMKCGGRVIAALSSGSRLPQ